MFQKLESFAWTRAEGPAAREPATDLVLVLLVRLVEELAGEGGEEQEEERQERVLAQGEGVNVDVVDDWHAGRERVGRAVAGPRPRVAARVTPMDLGMGLGLGCWSSFPGIILSAVGDIRIHRPNGL